jgi:hypothetical protein
MADIEEGYEDFDRYGQRGMDGGKVHTACMHVCTEAGSPVSRVPDCYVYLGLRFRCRPEQRRGLSWQNAAHLFLKPVSGSLVWSFGCWPVVFAQDPALEPAVNGYVAFENSHVRAFYAGGSKNTPAPKMGVEVRNRITFAMPFYTKKWSFLPRQALDKHRENSQRDAGFLQVVGSTGRIIMDDVGDGKVSRMVAPFFSEQAFLSFVPSLSGQTVVFIHKVAQM